MNELQVIENNGRRVLTTNQIAEAYDTENKVISNNFNRNKTRYVEGKHYYCLAGDIKRDFINRHQIKGGSKATNFYLWTETGALLHAKSLNTDKAWEVYDQLVETYFNVREQKSLFTDLSPQLQLLINIETMQKQQQKDLDNTNQRLDNIGEVIALDKNSWRKDAQHLISKIAMKNGGFESIRDCYTEVYKLVEERAGVSLSIRLTNKRNRMAGEGVCKSKHDTITKIDIIADDKKLIEIYLAIVKEMAVKYGVCD